MRADLGADVQGRLGHVLDLHEVERRRGHVGLALVLPGRVEPIDQRLDVAGGQLDAAPAHSVRRALRCLWQGGW